MGARSFFAVTNRDCTFAKHGALGLNSEAMRSCSRLTRVIGAAPFGVPSLARTRARSTPVPKATKSKTAGRASVREAKATLTSSSYSSVAKKLSATVLS